MSHPDQSLLQAAERLVAFEADNSEGLRAEPGAATVARIHERLQRQLATVVGEMGFQALFARSVKLTGRSFPALGQVLPLAAPDSILKQLSDHLRTQTHEANAAIISALVVNLVTLLSTFIGDALTLKLLHNAWPEVLPTRTPPGEKP